MAVHALRRGGIGTTKLVDAALPCRGSRLLPSHRSAVQSCTGAGGDWIEPIFAPLGRLEVAMDEGAVCLVYGNRIHTLRILAEPNITGRLVKPSNQR